LSLVAKSGLVRSKRGPGLALPFPIRAGLVFSQEDRNASTLFTEVVSHGLIRGKQVGYHEVYAELATSHDALPHFLCFVIQLPSHVFGIHNKPLPFTNLFSHLFRVA